MPEEKSKHTLISISGLALVLLWVVDYLQVFPGVQLSWYGLTPQVAGIVGVMMFLAVEIWKRI